MKRYISKNIYVTLFLCSINSLSFSIELPKDDYKIVIRNDSGLSPIWYAFYKTNLIGKVDSTQVYSDNPALRLQENPQNVAFFNFPALTRNKALSERATTYTKLFISQDPDALKAVLNNRATSAEKKLVVSVKIPTKIGDYCKGTLTFIITEKKGKLAINKPDDQRICMNSASQEAQESRKVEAKKRGQAAGEKKIKELNAKRAQEKEAAKQ